MSSLIVNGKAITDVRLVAFDKDGTLIDLYHYWSRMIDYRARKICELFGIDGDTHTPLLMDAMGVDLKKMAIKREGPVGLHPRTIVQKAAEGHLVRSGIKRPTEKCRKAFLMADEYSIEHLADIVKPLEGVSDLLHRLKDKGIKIALATSDKRERARLTLEVLGLSGIFDIIVGFDMVARPKPAADTLNLVNQQLKIDPQDSVMIGDIYADLEMSRNAGYKAAIALKSSITEQRKLKELTPYIIDRFSQIIVKD